MSGFELLVPVQKKVLTELNSARHIFDRLEHITSGDCNCCKSRQEVEFVKKELKQSLKNVESQLDVLEELILTFQATRTKCFELNVQTSHEQNTVSALRRFIIEAMDEVLIMREKLLNQGQQERLIQLNYDKLNLVVGQRTQLNGNGFESSGAITNFRQSVDSEQNLLKSKTNLCPLGVKMVALGLTMFMLMSCLVIGVMLLIGSN
ncbi:hypothetical protein HDE_08053 [Halotydeus destructor]|nr:hypothetical protein HDE_08053 [Halotydeus destructor]